MKLINHPITGREPITDASTPYSALANFYSAFNQQHFDLMKSNWLQSEEASMCNPLGGIKRGWREIKEVYTKIFRGPARVYVAFYDYSLHVRETMFVAGGRERGIIEINGVKMDLAIRTTRIYLLHEQQWKQLHHHGSMDDPKLLAKYQSVLSSMH